MTRSFGPKSIRAEYVRALWDYVSVLDHRARISSGADRELLLEQADDVLRELEVHLGRRPIDENDFLSLLRVH